jgi:acetyl esterase/lipase
LATTPADWQTDGVSQIYLILSIVALAATVNALRPLPWTVFAVPSFFAGWLTSELAPHHLFANATASIVFVSLGALDGPAGWLALGFSIAAAAGLVMLIVQSQQAREVAERALRNGLGEEYMASIPTHRSASYDLRVPWRQLLLPFHMTHPEVERIKNVPYGEIRRRNLLDVYRHRSQPAGCPTLLQIHGGGWVVSSKNQQGKPIMLHLASRGWVCFAPNYRLSPRAAWPAHIIDVKRALAWIREHGADYGADPGFVVVTGGSAGGHLAALMALTENDPAYQPGFEDIDTSVQAAVPHYGVYDIANEVRRRGARQRLRMLERIVWQKPFADHREDYERASPLYRIHPDAPPVFVIHGAHDSLVPVEEARHFVERLRSVSRSPVVYAELPGTQHAFDVFPSIRTAHVIRAFERFADHVSAARRSAPEDASLKTLP